MMKAEHDTRTGDLRLKISDESLLDSFDPVIEGSSSLEVPEVAAQTFDLGESLARIPNKLFFRIGDAAELLDVKPYVLRFWETEFPMVRPTKSTSGQRVYRKKDVEMLLLIKHLLYVERFSIEGARKRIRELKLKPSIAAAPVTAPSMPSSTVAQASLAPIRETLAAAKELASADISKFFRF